MNMGRQRKPIRIGVNLLNDFHRTYFSRLQLVVLTHWKPFLGENSPNRIANLKMHFPATLVCCPLVFDGRALQVILRFQMDVGDLVDKLDSSSMELAMLGKRSQRQRPRGTTP